MPYIEANGRAKADGAEAEQRAIEALLARHGFRFSKSKGQNFLIDRAVPRAIAEASGADERCGVLEIGPGVGALSSELCRRAGKVVAVELDTALLPILGETMADFGNFELISADALKLDLPSLVQQKFAGLTPIVCANLPYNITTPVLTKLVEARCFKRLTVLIQREVAQRICAAPGTAAYGAFSVFMQYHTAPELCFEVGPDRFIPRPKVTSAVLRAELRETPPVAVADEAFFFRVVYAAFALRRKTLVNSLMTGFAPLGKAQLTELVVSCGLDADVRGERLGLAEFARLADALREAGA